MSKIFNQNSSVSCFFCLSTITPVPRNPRSFRCPYCDCWNRYDVTGEIISDEPAMHDENLNARSFAKRASPRKDRLPTTYDSGLFCHTCQTNQMLLANLLSNYLPSPDDPEYEQRSEMFPEYRRSIETRYPPVCANCAPAVEEELRKRDNMARTRALGGFLRASGGARSQVTQVQRDKDRLDRQITIWKVRGALWIGCLICTLAGHFVVACGFTAFQVTDSVKPIIPAIVVLSILWTAWDPTYASMRRAQFQGRAVRLRGKKEYNILQTLAWLSRCMTAILLSISWFKPGCDPLNSMDQPQSLPARMYCSTSIILELIILIRSYVVLQLQKPPSVRLTVDPSTYKQKLANITSQTRSRGATPVVEPDLLAPLTLSPNPVLMQPTGTSAPNAVFGRPSLPMAQQPSTPPQPRPPLNSGSAQNFAMDVEDDDDLSPNRNPDAMDWSPINSPVSSRHNPYMSGGRSVTQNEDNDGSWLRPQRFFAPEEPTGLENLFANTIKLADDDQTRNKEQVEARAAMMRWNWQRILRFAIWISMLCLIPLVGVVYKLWGNYASTILDRDRI